MPGRVSVRSSTVTRISRKSSTQTLNSRRTTTAIIIPEETSATRLRTQICTIFSDAQKSNAGHRKLAAKLRKTQESCSLETANLPAKSDQIFGEDDFIVEVTRCIVRLMCVKKGESVGDRVLRFLELFLRYASDKDATAATEAGVDLSQVTLETSTTRLVSHVLSVLLPLLGSKEKTVRYRATQVVAHIVNSLDSIDDETYHLLRMSLLKRIRDKESIIRVQAVLGLGRLAGNEEDCMQEDADSDGGESNSLLDRLLDILQNDPSAEVRRSLLVNLPLTPGTLPFLLERARDLDPATRRALYSKILPALGDFRHLSLSMREKLLRWGLRDRDEIVRRATGRLFRERWIGDCAGTQVIDDDGSNTDPKAPSVDGLLELLERIDVLNSAAGNGVALEAMKEFWNGRPDYRDMVTFDDPFWDRLTPESIFMARSLINFYQEEQDDKYESLLEEKMPEVTKLAFILQRYTNDLIERIRYTNTSSDPGGDEDIVEQEFIVEQLLHIAKTLDYTDEVGRRKMFALLREILSIAELPEEVTRLVVDVLRNVNGKEATGEREFCSVVLEAVAEVHDTIALEDPTIDNEDESFHSARSELSDTPPTKPKMEEKDEVDNSEVEEAKAIKEIMINLKCLHIAQCMLENVEGSLQQNVHLVTMLNNLVVPAVRSHEAPIRERGLACLGLCCLLDKALADENLTLFLHCYSKGHDALQVSAIHVLCDILATHPTLLTLDTADPGLQKSISKIFAKALKGIHTPEVQCAATTALCKLMLLSIIRDEDLLKQAVTCYFDPSTRENAGVIQALSYFLPIYCYSRRENMDRMASVAAAVMQNQVDLADELEADEDMVGIGMVGNMLVDWTDARKLVVQDETSVSWDEAGKREGKAVNGDIHLSLAASLLERCFVHSCTREEKKALISMLGKIYVTSNSSPERLEEVYYLVTDAIDGKVAVEAVSRNALAKLHLALSKAMGEASKTRTGSEDSHDQTTTEDVQDAVSTLGPNETLGHEKKVDVSEVDSGEDGKDTLLDELLDEEDEEG
ncbi:MAG: hypothetical protein LQ342_002711 [Letrouitia transgressa]|nr:MAG: hypothetical protein LQ342_002711 [Letrouitia transgressa]